MNTDSVIAEIGTSVAEQNTSSKLWLFLNLLELPASCYLLDLLRGGKGENLPSFLLNLDSNWYLIRRCELFIMQLMHS